jgi:hypothetical protein
MAKNGHFCKNDLSKMKIWVLAKNDQNGHFLINTYVSQKSIKNDPQNLMKIVKIYVFSCGENSRFLICLMKQIIQKP